MSSSPTTELKSLTSPVMIFTFLNEQEMKQNDSLNKSDAELNLKVIELTEEENKAHKDYLLRMKEETGIDPLGLN